KLWQKFADNGRTDFDFVGTRNAGDACNVSASYDKDSEGHAGYQVTDVLKAVSTGRPSSADPTDPYDASAKDLGTWFDGHPVDLLLLHMGSNDIMKLNASTDSILSAYSAIVARARLSSPNVTVFVAQIIPMNVSSCDTCNTQIQALNAAIPGWATTTDTSASHVHVVNQYAGFDVANTIDGIRPNETGSQIMADKWYEAIVAVFP
ncbi:MAG TPA: GDSL-type esterase/lipase family protein, partial [Polyangiaceae bacterium]|nr:GDSL-type esterase/lipase family protein [Polyangiaceae bacterium]